MTYKLTKDEVADAISQWIRTQKPELMNSQLRIQVQTKTGWWGFGEQELIVLVTEVKERDCESNGL